MIILFGATGYTGTLTAHSLARRGVPALLAGRSSEKLVALADELAEEYQVRFSTATADVTDPASVRGLLQSQDDVLVTTVGPFEQWGEPAVSAAIDAGATYIDSTGEPPFIRRIFEQWGPQARGTSSALLTAFGYDYVPGNLAGAVAIERGISQGHQIAKVDVGYFTPTAPGARAGISGGTKASAAGIMLSPSYAWHSGKLVTERPAKRVRSFDVTDPATGRTQELTGLTVGGTEPFGLPRLCPTLTDVDVYLGWAGRRSADLSRFSTVADLAARIPGVRSGLRSAARRVGGSGSTGGPDADARAGVRTLAVAETFDRTGKRLDQVIVDGPSPYDLTGELLAWAAIQADAGAIERTGALAPTDAFGTDGLVAGCASIGMLARA